MLAIKLLRDEPSKANGFMPLPLNNRLLTFKWSTYESNFLFNVNPLRKLNVCLGFICGNRLYRNRFPMNPRGPISLMESLVQALKLISLRCY
jgi:hypothetical protein